MVLALYWRGPEGLSYMSVGLVLECASGGLECSWEWFLSAGCFSFCGVPWSALWSVLVDCLGSTHAVLLAKFYSYYSCLFLEGCAQKRATQKLTEYPSPKNKSLNNKGARARLP